MERNIYRKQVNKEHYEFSRYVSKRRWTSIWHQLDSVLALEPKSILEIGPGPGVFKALASLFDVEVKTLDLDSELGPDYIAPADNMPFKDNSFDVVCAFQMLEHVPYEASLAVFAEMCRVAKRYIVISLPDARPGWAYSLYIPKRGQVNFIILRPWLGPKEHVFNGEHYWELNKKGYSVSKVMEDLGKVVDAKLVHTYRVVDFPYHHFFIYEKKYI